MKLSKITFSDSARGDILSLYGKSVDKEGFIVEKGDISQKVLTPQGEEIRLEEWAGIRKGSEAFIKKDIFSLIELAKKLD
ncbi:hypothetical protein HY495_03090 [Candidatus Woesearchaeota archaeon]|nr:hypothetical protein [Candidatus Woesearchaeota archaeon]